MARTYARMRTEVDIHTTLTAEQYRLLCLVAESEQCRRADIIQRALTDYLREHAPKALKQIGADLKRST